MIDVIEILTHWYAGRSQNELATSLGVDRKTLRKYTAPAVAAGLAPAWIFHRGGRRCPELQPCSLDRWPAGIAPVGSPGGRQKSR